MRDLRLTLLLQGGPGGYRTSTAFGCPLRRALNPRKWSGWKNTLHARRSAEPSRIVNMKQILQESFRFSDSRDELGLQLADIVASACRRAFNGNLQRRGWEGIAQLLIKKDGKPPILVLA